MLKVTVLELGTVPLVPRSPCSRPPGPSCRCRWCSSCRSTSPAPERAQPAQRRGVVGCSPTLMLDADRVVLMVGDALFTVSCSLFVAVHGLEAPLLLRRRCRPLASRRCRGCSRWLRSSSDDPAGRHGHRVHCHQARRAGVVGVVAVGDRPEPVEGAAPLSAEVSWAVPPR